MYVCSMYVCMCVCMYVCMYVCICLHIVYPFCLGSVSKYFLVNELKEIALWGNVFGFLIGYSLLI